MASTISTSSGDRIAAGALVLGALGGIVVGATHPQVRHGAGKAVDQIVRLSGPDALVHAIAIASVAATLFGLLTFSMRRGIGRPPVLAAAIAYAMGVVFFMGAATLDGFVVPGMASIAGNPQMPESAALAVLTACAIAIQICTKGGLIVQAIGIGFWSIDLLGTQGRPRSVAAFGVVAAIVTIAFSVAPLRINPHLLLAILLLPAAWYAAVAALLVRNAAEPLDNRTAV